MSLEDNLYKLLKVYKNLPSPVKNCLGRLYRVLPNRLKHGGFYYEYNKRIKSHEKTTNRLEKQLIFASKNERLWQARLSSQIWKSY